MRFCGTLRLSFWGEELRFALEVGGVVTTVGGHSGLDNTVPNGWLFNEPCEAGRICTGLGCLGWFDAICLCNLKASLHGQCSSPSQLAITKSIGLQSQSKQSIVIYIYLY